MTQSCGGKSERQEVPGRDSVIGETYRKKSVSITGKPKVGCPDLDLWELLGTYDKYDPVMPSSSTVPRHNNSVMIYML